MQKIASQTYSGITPPLKSVRIRTITVFEKTNNRKIIYVCCMLYDNKLTACTQALKPF